MNISLSKDQNTHSTTDISQLQREYRNMEMNRKVYADESHQVMRRQQLVIEKLKKDNEDMRTEISLATRHMSENEMTHQQDQISKFQEQMEHFTKKIQQENKKLETINQQITIMKHKVLHQKKNMGGINAAKENQAMVSKQIRILENRLDKSLIKFNEALAQNKILREEIDNLRKERIVFENIYKKLEKEHLDKKKQMAQAIEASNLAYEQRDAAQMEIRAIQETNRLEIEEHRRQLTELMEKLEESQRKIQQFHHSFFQQQQEEQEEEEEEEEEKRETGTGEFKKTKSHKRTAWKEMKEKAQLQVSEERVQNFEQAFLKIRAATGISNLNELVDTFIKKEDQNFSLFNYVNEQTHEIEKLEETIQQLKQEEKKNMFTKEGEEINQEKQLLKELEQKIQNTEQNIVKNEIKSQEAQKNINAIKIGIQTLFNRIGCHHQEMSDFLGENVVTETNMMQFLGIIEQKTNEILQEFAYYQKIQQQQKLRPSTTSFHSNREDYFQQEMAQVPFTPTSTSTSTSNAINSFGNTVSTAKGIGAIGEQNISIFGHGPLHPMGQEPLQINPPNLEDYSSEEDENSNEEDEEEEEKEKTKPLTRDELKIRTLKGLRKTSTKTSPNKKKSQYAVQLKYEK